MKRKNLLLIFTLLAFQSLSFSQTTLINFGSNWSYYDLGNEPVDQASLDWNDTNKAMDMKRLRSRPSWVANSDASLRAYGTEYHRGNC